MIEQLLTLQRLDGEVDGLRTGALEAPQRQARAQGEYDEKKKQLDTAKTQLAAFEKERSDFQETLRLEEIRLKKSKMRINEIKTNYEYQAMRREIETTERSNTELQEQIAQRNAEIDRLVTLSTQLEADLAALRATLDGTMSDAATKKVEFDSLLHAKEQERKTLEGGIDRGLLSKYRMIRERKYKDALVAVIAGACQGCFMNVPPQMENEILRRGAGIYQCPNCQRLLYATGTKTA
ncbi:MAG: C4-type zinc ribbon domain-containing protein [Pseudomonadota bacterium]